MWMLLLAVVATAAWAEKHEDSRNDEYTLVSFSAATDESATATLTKGGITLTLSQGTWTPVRPDGGTAGWELSAGTTITVSGGDIVRIPITFTGVQWGDPVPVGFSQNTVDALEGFKNNYYWYSKSDAAHPSVTINILSDCKLKALDVQTVPSGETVVEAPVIEGEEYFDESATVTITAAEGAEIRYTTDYNVPTVSSDLYAGPFTITETTRVQAIAVKDGISSTVTARNFTRRLAKPVAPVITGDSPFVGSTEITITSDGATDQIYYTLDGTEPTYESTAYTGPFYINETTTVKAMYVRNGGPSEVAEATFVKYEAPRPDEKTIRQLADDAKDADGVTLRLEDAVVVYGESGADGSVRVVRDGGKAIDLMDTGLALPVGTRLSGTVKLNVRYDRGVLSAYDIAGETNQNNLQTSHDGNYEMRPVDVTGSQIADHPGDLVRLEGVTVSVSQGVYTATATDGGQSYEVRLLNGEEFQLKDGQTCGLTAWYSETGSYGVVAMMRVASVEQQYQAPLPPVIEGEETFDDQATVTITSEPGTTIHYTLDGSNPTTLSPLYTRPFVITRTTTVKALAERDELASPMAEKTFTKREAAEWVSTTLDQVAEGGEDVPFAILTLENAKAVFTADYGRSWVVRDGEQAMQWTTSQRLATNYGYAGTVRVRIEYNGGFLRAYDIEGETTMDDIEVDDHFGDYDYYFTTCHWQDILDGKHKGDFIMLKHVKVTREQQPDGTFDYYAGEGEQRMFLENKKGFEYYWNSDPTERHDVGGWYDAPQTIYVARLRLGVGTPGIEGEDQFYGSTKVRIVPDNQYDDLYYTTDGSDPDPDTGETTLSYAGQFTIRETTTIKAVATRYEGKSDIVERTFTCLGTGIGSAVAEGKEKDGVETYNLAGQRVGKDYKGIVVERGTKTLRK